ncbi:MAG TPA: response regulator transcription factor, partial [Brevibacterium sp.]|nr:response regulator transcription factor [Brevibacterium sp.]
MTRILIVEDEDRISSFIAKGLAAEGFATEVAGDGHLAVEFVRGGSFDLVILDLGLPGLDGFSVLRMIRAERHDLPVIILTARESIEDTVAGLSGGADDYMRKPFAFDELLARVRLRLRPSEGQEATVLRAGDVAVDIRTRRALVG